MLNEIARANLIFPPSWRYFLRKDENDTAAVNIRDDYDGTSNLSRVRLIAVKHFKWAVYRCNGEGVANVATHGDDDDAARKWMFSCHCISQCEGAHLKVKSLYERMCDCCCCCREEESVEGEKTIYARKRWDDPNCRMKWQLIHSWSGNVATFIFCWNYDGYSWMKMVKASVKCRRHTKRKSARGQHTRQSMRVARQMRRFVFNFSRCLMSLSRSLFVAEQEFQITQVKRKFKSYSEGNYRFTVVSLLLTHWMFVPPLCVHCESLASITHKWNRETVYECNLVSSLRDEASAGKAKRCIYLEADIRETRRDSASSFWGKKRERVTHSKITSTGRELVND